MALPLGTGPAATDTERAMSDFVDAYDRAYESAAAQHGLTAAQACVLSRLSEPRGMGQLAAELECDASNITQIVSRLESRDLTERRAHPSDRRSRQLLRTAAGDELMAAFEESFEFARRASENLTAAERHTLTTLLRKALQQNA